MKCRDLNLLKIGSLLSSTLGITGYLLGLDLPSFLSERIFEYLKTLSDVKLKRKLPAMYYHFCGSKDVIL